MGVCVCVCVGGGNEEWESYTIFVDATEFEY